MNFENALSGIKSSRQKIEGFCLSGLLDPLPISRAMPYFNTSSGGSKKKVVRLLAKIKNGCWLNAGKNEMVSWQTVDFTQNARGIL